MSDELREIVEAARKDLRDATAILADWAEEGGFNSVDVDEERARAIGAFDSVVAALDASSSVTEGRTG